jgi:hypothetical protein
MYGECSLKNNTPDSKNNIAIPKFIHSGWLYSKLICKFYLMGNCRKSDYCKFHHINEKQLMNEIDKESEQDKGNIVIMGFDPNSNK